MKTAERSRSVPIAPARFRYRPRRRSSQRISIGWRLCMCGNRRRAKSWNTVNRRLGSMASLSKPSRLVGRAIAS
jgi:hypothetical protein